MTERRHRLNADEIPEVMEALKLRLWYHLENRQSLADATTSFKAYYRMIEHRQGKPNYPKDINWKIIEYVVGLPPYEVVPLIREVVV